MKNIVILSTNKIYQGNTAGAARLMSIAKALSLNGNKIFLCSAELNERISIGNLKEISKNVFLVGEENHKNNGKYKEIFSNGIGYILLIAGYLKRINALMKKIEGEKIVYFYPQTKVLMDLISLIIFKYLNGNKIYCDMNELRRGGLYNREFSKNFLKRIIRPFVYSNILFNCILSENISRYYDGLVVISTNIESYFARYNKNLLRVPILSDTSKKLFSSAPILKNEDKFSMCFTGWISLKKEGFDILYDALSKVKIKFKNFQLNLFGPVSKHSKNLLLNDLPLKYGIKENIIYHGFIEHKNIMKEMQKNHLLILPRPQNLQTKYGFSTKLSEYLVSGIPVLVTDVSDNALYIKDGYNGIIVKPGDAHEMAEKIIYIINNYNYIANGIVQNAYDTAMGNFHYANYSKQLNNFLK